jgi:periplasmic protein TonB
MKSTKSYLDLLFENRNKAYGAYELRMHYNDRFLRSFGYALLIASLFFLVPYVLTLILTHPKPAGDIFKSTVVEIQPEIIFETRAQHISPPEVRTVAENNFRVVTNIVPIERIENIRQENVESTTAAIESSTGIGAVNEGSIVSPPSDVLPIETVMNAAVVDVVPAFPGGEKALMKFLENNIHYTSKARENNIKGKVFAYFVVNEKGEIINIEIKRSLEQSLDQEVIRVLKKMPDWSPGIYNGNPVKTALILPVLFNLNK